MGTDLQTPPQAQPGRWAGSLRPRTVAGLAAVLMAASAGVAVATLAGGRPGGRPAGSAGRSAHGGCADVGIDPQPSRWAADVATGRGLLTGAWVSGRRAVLVGRC